MATLVEIATKIKTLKEVEVARKELEAKEKALKEELKAEMTTRGVKELQVGIFHISWKMIIQKRIDTERMKTEAPETYAKFLHDVPSERFTVK